MKNAIVIFLVFTVFLSCKRDPPIVPDYLDPSRFPAEVQPEIKRFLKEGNDRGVYLDINKIKEIELTGNLFVKNIQVSAYYHPGKNIISIDTSSVFFKCDIGREWIIYHELGHGLIKREHKNDLFPSGQIISMMHATIPPFYVNVLCIQSPTINRRSYYVDELFNINTLWPNWAY